MNLDYYALEYLKCRKNPFYFIYNYVYISEIGGSIQLTEDVLHFKMKRVVRSIVRYHRVMMMASRQKGKSTIAAALLLWAANFYANLPVIIINMRQVAALENLNKIKFIHSKLPSWLKTKFKSKAERKTYIEFQNGSLIRTFYPSPNSPPDQLARSLTSPILYIDEAAFIRHIKVAYSSCQPVLSKAQVQAEKNGYPYFILMTSTPNGTIGDGQFFYDFWENGIDSDEIFDENENIIKHSDTVVNNSEKNGFVKVRYHWSEDPLTDDEWYVKQKRDLNFDKRKINQELDLLFIGSTYCIFDDEILSKLTPKKPIKILNLSHFSKFKMFEEINENEFYILSIDSAKSLTGDFCAIEIFTYSNFRQVGEYFGKLGSLTKLAEVAANIIKYITERSNNRLIIGIENNGGFGTAVIEYLENNTNYGNLLFSDKADKHVLGIQTTSRSKDIMISVLYDNIVKYPENINSIDLINQLSIIEKKQNGSVSAKHGQHDDLFMASCFCAYVKKLSMFDIEPLMSATYEEDQDKNDNMLFSTVDLTYDNKIEKKYDEDEEKSDEDIYDDKLLEFLSF